MLDTWAGSGLKPAAEGALPLQLRNGLNALRVLRIIRLLRVVRFIHARSELLLNSCSTNLKRKEVSQTDFYTMFNLLIQHSFLNANLMSALYAKGLGFVPSWFTSRLYNRVFIRLSLSP